MIAYTKSKFDNLPTHFLTQLNMDNEMAQFQADLLASVWQMKAGQAASVTEVKFARSQAPLGNEQDLLVTPPF